MTKKTIFSMAAAALLAVPAFAGAQTVNASAAVGTYMNLTGASTINFGSLSRTANTTIDPTGASAGTRSVDYNQNMTVTYSSVSTNLTATINGSTANLPVSLKCAYKIGTGSWSSATACSSASFAMNVGAALTTGTLGFGGDILATDVANALAGSYNGSLTVVLTAR